MVLGALGVVLGAFGALGVTLGVVLGALGVTLAVTLGVVLGVAEDELRRFSWRDLVGALGAGGPIKPGRRLLRDRGFLVLDDGEVPGLP